MRSVTTQTSLSQPHALVKLLAVLILSILAVGVVATASHKAGQTSSATVTPSADQPLPAAKAPVAAESSEPPISGPVQGNGASSNTDIQIQSTQTNSSQPPRTDVTINGRAVPTPDTGPSHTVITDENGTTTLDTNSTSTTSNGHASSSTNVQINSHTDSSVDAGP